MAVFKDFQGILNRSLQFADPNGGIVDFDAVNNEFSLLDADGTTLIELLLAHNDASSSLNAASTLLGLIGRLPEIEQQFDGATPPAAGDNTGKFLICSTAGGTYNLHDIVYDTGSALITLPTRICRHFTVKSALTGGTAEYIAGGLYAREGSGVALRGDGSGTLAGNVRVIKVSYAYTDTNVDSTSTIPSGAIVTRVQNKLTTPFNGTSPTVEVKVNGSTPVTLIPTAAFFPKETDYAYDNDADIVDIGANNTGAVRVTVTSSGSSAGAGVAYVFYSSPLV